MLVWEQSQIDAVSAAIDNARSGQPSVILVEGDPGSGKSTLLDHIETLTPGFQVRSTAGRDSDIRPPYLTLSGWTSAPNRASDGQPVSPFVAAQNLRELIDELADHGPVLLRLDDLQWADPDTVEALTWLMQRAEGDQLLVAVGTRVQRPVDHAAWQRWAGTSPHVHHLRLSGLSFELARELIAAKQPDLDLEASRYLWQHTSGNPLFLTSLLDEHDRTELTRMRVLPAPAEFARSLNTRLSTLSTPAVALLQAVTVLGTDWVPLIDAAVVGDVERPTTAAAELTSASLLLERPDDLMVSVRLPHALIRAALYQYMDLTDRRRLHARAADVATQQTAALQHRVLAADHYDEALAVELEEVAAELHDDGSYRLAAQHLRWASSLTAGVAERNRRWLESLFESTMARDLSSVRAELFEVRRAKDRQRATLVTGSLLVMEKQWLEAARELSRIDDEPLGTGDPLTRYRSEVLLAWARVGTGAPTAAISEGLGRAATLGVADNAMVGYLSFASGQLAGRLGGPEDLAATFDGLPGVAAAVPMEYTEALSWRGIVRLRRGFITEAIDDLAEVERRLQGGFNDFSDGLLYAGLGSAYWFSGAWQLADAKLRLAVDVANGAPNPLTQTVIPIVAAGRGDADRARAELDPAVNALRAAPWPEALEDLLIVEVILHHASGDAAGQRSLIDQLRQWFGSDLTRPEGSVSALWLLHLCIALVWAGELDHAAESAQRMATLPFSPDWAWSASHWMLALVAEARGDGATATAEITRAISRGVAELPLYQGHLLSDYGRITGSIEHDAEARRLDERLGAAAYLRRPTPEYSAEVPDDALAPLSDRERDVVALVVTGMSYAQISRDLFISRSTVGFHLSNIYAKTGTTSRHELTDLVRQAA